MQHRVKNNYCLTPLTSGDGMVKETHKVAVITMEGVNCEFETMHVFQQLGVDAEMVHVKNLVGLGKPRKERDIYDYQMLVFPGGFSGGDYVRGGAIFASIIKARLADRLADYVRDGNLVLGICNGFQVLIELGLLPGGKDVMALFPQVALAPNETARFETRETYVRKEKSHCNLTKYLKKRILYMPSAHAEGRFVVDTKKGEKMLNMLEKEGYVVFRWVDRQGNTAGYPWNPNGALNHIAGLCDTTGNVLGLMPHPERSFYAYHMPEWTWNHKGRYGDGHIFFKAIVDYMQKHM